MNLSKIDLNLLVVLDALLVERSVSRAAVRLGLSQPALSHSLQRLRDLLGDPVLVRTGRDMVPTDRALSLIPALNQALSAIRQTLAPPEAFSPACSSRSFTIVSSDMVSVALLPSLLEELACEAPAIDLVVHQYPSRNLEDRLIDGSVDLAIGRFTKASAGIRRQLLYQERFVCMLRQDHPAAQTALLSLDDWCGLFHLLVAPGGTPGSLVDDELAKLGKSRHIKLTVSQFLVAPHVVARSNLVWTAPSRMAELYSGLLPVVLRPVPIALEGFAMSQLWHERIHHDPAHAWLRAKIHGVAKRFSSL